MSNNSNAVIGTIILLVIVIIVIAISAVMAIFVMRQWIADFFEPIRKKYFVKLGFPPAEARRIQRSSRAKGLWAGIGMDALRQCHTHRMLPGSMLRIQSCARIMIRGLMIISRHSA